MWPTLCPNFGCETPRPGGSLDWPDPLFHLRHKPWNPTECLIMPVSASDQRPYAAMVEIWKALPETPKTPRPPVDDILQVLLDSVPQPAPFPASFAVGASLQSKPNANKSCSQGHKGKVVSAANRYMYYHVFICILLFMINYDNMYQTNKKQAIL